MVKSYEAMFLVDPTTTAKDSSKIPDYVRGILDKHNVKILQESKWAERALAYSIKGRRRGNYYLVYFDAPAENILKIKQECELTPGILRSIVLILEPSEKTKILSGPDKTATPVEKPNKT